jgi:hypothetical protein
MGVPLYVTSRKSAVSLAKLRSRFRFAGVKLEIIWKDIFNEHAAISIQSVHSQCFYAFLQKNTSEPLAPQLHGQAANYLIVSSYCQAFLRHNLSQGHNILKLNIATFLIAQI